MSTTGRGGAGNLPAQIAQANRLRHPRLSVVFLLAALAVHGAENNQDRGKRVIQQALAALGGDHFLSMQDRVESGRAYSFYRNELSGLSFAKIYTRYLTRPEPPLP